MSTFKNMFNENVLFTKKGKKDYKIVLQLESKNDNIIVSYLEDNIKREMTISSKELKSFTFLEKTGNVFHNKHRVIDNPRSLVTEETIEVSMTRRGSGVFRKLSQAVRVDEGIEVTYDDNYLDKTLVIKEEHMEDYVFLKRFNKELKFNPFNIIKEMDTGGAGIGGTADSTFSSDFYAPGDARVPNAIGSKKKKKTPMIRRPKIEDQIALKRPKAKKNGKSK
jgi:hypothetical protein